MSNSAEFCKTFELLRSILNHHADKLVCVKDDPNYFYLETKFIMKNKKPMFFSAVQITKSYISYHLMPVYVFPELLAHLSPELKQRMQGKSCFNFKSPDEALFEELSQLTKNSFEKFVKAGYV